MLPGKDMTFKLQSYWNEFNQLKDLVTSGSGESGLYLGGHKCAWKRHRGFISK